MTDRFFQLYVHRFELGTKRIKSYMWQFWTTFHDLQLACYSLYKLALEKYIIIMYFSSEKLACYILYSKLAEDTLTL